MGERRKMTKAEQREMRKYRAEIRKRIRAKGAYRELPPKVKEYVRDLRKHLTHLDGILYFHHIDSFSKDVMIRETAQCIESLGLAIYREIQKASIGFKDGVPYCLVPPTKKGSCV